MKQFKIVLSFVFITVLVLNANAQSEVSDLHNQIVRMDSIFFTAYNNCDMATQQAIYSDSIEFYHDKGGLSTSKEELLASTKKYICDKVTRELVKGSIEVSPIPGYGAVELGSHMFRNNQEKDQQPHASKFIIIWKIADNNWKITRVISLH